MYRTGNSNMLRASQRIVVVDDYHVNVKNETPTPTPTTSPSPNVVKKHRPKSSPSPSRIYSSSSTHSKMYRPKTAAAILTRTDCERVLQLEHEPTRRHNFETHLEKKRNKPPPWQKKLDSPLVPFVVGPGYILSRSKSRCHMTLKDNFFDSAAEEKTKKKEAESEKDILIRQLQEQISNLNLFLEEERLNHKLTKKKTEEFLCDKTNEFVEYHNNQIRQLAEEHEKKLQKQKDEMEQEFEQYKMSSESRIQKLVQDIEFLQGAFDSYKSSLQAEMEEKWKVMENDWKTKHSEEKKTAMQELRMKLAQERSSEILKISKEQHQHIDALRKEHKKEIESMLRRFSNAASDIERLKKVTAELDETKIELEALKIRYNETCEQLANTTTLLAEAKITIMEYEQKFDDKVQAVDDKYRQRLDDLMMQNAELRRLFVQKCGELYDEKVLSESESMKRVESAKEAMTEVIKSKERANINMSAHIPELEKLARQPKTRPGSAPTTVKETFTAHLSAGETDHLRKQKEFIRPPPLDITEASPELEALRRELLSQEGLINSLNT